MKKLLGFLGAITIAGSGMAGLVGNAPASSATKNKINYLQTSSNNLENLNINKIEPQKRSNTKIVLEAVRDGATMFGFTTGVATAAATSPFTGAAAVISGAVAGVTGVIASNIN